MHHSLVLDTQHPSSDSNGCPAAKATARCLIAHCAVLEVDTGGAFWAGHFDCP
jgi:hypothetical protein